MTWQIWVVVGVAIFIVLRLAVAYGIVGRNRLEARRATELIPLHVLALDLICWLGLLAALIGLIGPYANGRLAGLGLLVAFVGMFLSAWLKGWRPPYLW